MGFTAVLPLSSLELTGDTIVFNETRANSGELYSVNSGVFTCPTPLRGLYHFQLSIKAQALNFAEGMYVAVDMCSQPSYKPS